MASTPFNIALGRAVELYKRVQENDPSTSQFVIMVLKTTVADSVMIDYDTFADILAGASVEADFTNYVRKFVVDTDLAAAAQDDTDDKFNIDMPNPTWSSAGGATNNTTAKIIIGYDKLGTNIDANIEPVGHYDFIATTDGNDITGNVDAAGFYSAGT